MILSKINQLMSKILKYSNLNIPIQLQTIALSENEVPIIGRFLTSHKNYFWYGLIDQ